MSEEKEGHLIPAWLDVGSDGLPVVIRTPGSVVVAMTIYDFNALVFLLGVAGAVGPDFLETALRLLRAFNPFTPPRGAAPPGMRPRASGGTEYP